MSKKLKKLVYSGLLLAIALVLPFLTGQIPEIGGMLCPMHIPVILCGFICGGAWGAAIGFIAPLLRFLLFGMPPLFPSGVGMAFELAAYGFFSGFFYKLLPKKMPYIYASLIFSMIIGRLLWGGVRYILAGLAGSAFTFEAFWAGAVVTAIPGIIVQIVLIPLLILAFRKAKLMLNE